MATFKCDKCGASKEGRCQPKKCEACGAAACMTKQAEAKAKAGCGCGCKAKKKG